MDTRPIGFFDSGLGGLSVLKAALSELPKENYVFFGDNRNAPYGDRTEDEITQLTLACADALVACGVKALVVACNTATATCIRSIRTKLDVPVVSVEPAIKPACALSGDGKILMMATRATTRLERYLALQNSMPEPKRILNVPSPGLVDRIEQGVFGDDAFDDILDGLLKPYWGMRIDGIVLGCTHFVFIKGAIECYAKAHFAGETQLFDGNAGTAKQLKNVLEAHGLQNPRGFANITFMTSGDRERLLPIFERLIAR